MRKPSNGRLSRPALPVLAACALAFTTTELAAQAGPRASNALAARPTTADVTARTLPSMATVLALGPTGDTLGQGSAFVVRDDGVLVTNYHVLRGASNAVVLLNSREQFTRVRVLDADSALDLAILKIPGAGLASLPTRTTIPRAGEKAIALGSPLGLANTVTEGIVSAVRLIGGRELVQISAPISHGSSGGAVLDADGKVFAVSTSYIEGGQALNFAVPVRYALGLLGDHPPERSIAEVFFDSTGIAAEGDRHIESAGVATAIRKAAVPKKDVSGVYQVIQLAYDSSGKVGARQRGILVATKHVGYLALFTVIDSTHIGPTNVYRAERWSTNPAGDVVLAAGGVSYDGYQSDADGFVMYGSVEGKPRRLYMGGVPAKLPLSRNDGIFSVTTRTFWERGGARSSEPIDWTGDMVVLFSAGKIYLDLYLQNSAGGSSAFYGTGTMKGDNIDLATKNGDRRLKGTLKNGVLTAEWMDKRDGGAAFVGTLRAERR